MLRESRSVPSKSSHSSATTPAPQGGGAQPGSSPRPLTPHGGPAGGPGPRQDPPRSSFSPAGRSDPPPAHLIPWDAQPLSGKTPLLDESPRPCKHHTSRQPGRARNNQPGPVREAHARRIRRALGIPEFATNQASARPSALGQLRSWVQGLGASLTALWSTEVEARLPAQPGTGDVQGGDEVILLLDSHEHDTPSHSAKAARYSSPAQIRQELLKLYRPDEIVVLDVEPGCDFIFPRNAIGIGPKGLLMTSRKGFGDDTESELRTRCSRRALISLCKQEGIPFELLDAPVDFANVVFFADLDLLVVTNTNLEGLDAVREAYGQPANTIYAVTRFEKEWQAPRDQWGAPACHDLDTAAFFLPLGKNAQAPQGARYGALVFDPCFEGPTRLNWDPRVAGSGEQTSRFSDMLRDKFNFMVEQTPQKDHARLVNNAIYRRLPNGEVHVLMTTPHVSPALLQIFERMDVKVFLPEEVIGSLVWNRTPHGLHCRTSEAPKAFWPAMAQRTTATPATPHYTAEPGDHRPLSTPAEDEAPHSEL